MNCPFCAEEIQDAATLCRFCGACRTPDGAWIAPNIQPRPALRRKGALTIKLAGAFFLLSGVLALASSTSEVPLLGAMRSGAVAICYSLLFAAMYLAMGVGLIVGQRWGYRLLLAGTLLYTVDRLAFVLDKRTRDAYVASGGLSSEIQSLIDMNMVDQGVIVTTFVMLACWWGFALYIYVKRNYFR